MRAPRNKRVPARRRRRVRSSLSERRAPARTRTRRDRGSRRPLDRRHRIHQSRSHHPRRHEAALHRSVPRHAQDAGAVLMASAGFGASAFTVQLDGFVEVQRSLRLLAPTMARQLTTDLKKAAEPVAHTAETFALDGGPVGRIRNMRKSPQWAVFRTGSLVGVIYI